MPNTVEVLGRRVAYALLVAAWAAAGVAHADQVVPRDTVTNHVNVRQGPSTGSAQIGILAPGEQLEFIESVDRWHVVRLPDGTRGFVSKAWTLVVPDEGETSPVVATSGNFSVHFLDVGTGDAAIIDMGDREVVIDGGDSVKVLNAYAQRTQVIDGPIELLVVTHGDSDHWKGLTRLLGFDGAVDNPPGVLEYWDPGYDRDCNAAGDSGRAGYLEFVSDVQGVVPAASFLRPLENHRPPASKTGTVASFGLPAMPGLTLTVLHSDADPDGSSCSYIINNASIVLMAEFEGHRFLFTGDANGKERDEDGAVAAGHVEQMLLAVEAARPGTLKADVLKVPHHGSETASTQAFIDAVDPAFVIISASTRHHLPKDTVVRRYDNGQRVILRTDESRDNDQDHIVCGSVDGTFDCNFVDVLSQ